MERRRRITMAAATSIAAALTLSGCGLFGGGEPKERSEESTQEQSAEATGGSEEQSAQATSEETTESSDSASPTESDDESASPSASESGGGSDGELSDSSVMGALNGEKVGGFEINAVPVSLMSASGYDIPSMLEESVGVVTVDPTSCEDPVKGSFMGGIMQSDMDEGVVGSDEEGNLIVTVHMYDSTSEAEDALDDFETGVKDCSEATMSVDDQPVDVQLENEDITVDSADTAIRTTLSAGGPGGSMDVHTGRMVYENSMISVIASEEYEGKQADYEELLTEIADLLATA